MGRILHKRHQSNQGWHCSQLHGKRRITACVDSEWQDAGSTRIAAYPGAYSFEVSAGNGDGVWNSPTEQINLSIARAYYQTPRRMIEDTLNRADLVLIEGRDRVRGLRSQR